MEDPILDHELDVDAAGLALLERHKPLLRFDPQYDYRLLAAESAVENPGNVLRTGDGEVIARAGGSPALSLDTLSAYPPGTLPSGDDSIAFAPDLQGDSRSMELDPRFAGRIYGRVVKGTDSRTWLQYWFWLYYNPKNLFGFGKHEGDWEMVQVGLNADGTPETLTYAQHTGGEGRKWNSRGVAFATSERLRPVVYVAQASHASYFKPRTYPLLLFRLALIGIDHPRGDGPAREYPVVPFGRWARWPGHWGSTERSIVGEGKGPPSPARQGLKWNNPARWHWLRRRLQLIPFFVGWLLYVLGRLTYPRVPEITHAQSDGRQVKIGWKMNRLRPRRHLYITVHDGERVVASRVVKRADGYGATTVRVPEGQSADQVIVSAFNVFRQRSDLTRAQIEYAELAPVADLHAHYAMHLVPRAPRGFRRLIFFDAKEGRLSDRCRAVLVGVASLVANYRSFWSGPRVTIGSLRSGGVRVALSVLYSFFDELALGHRYPARPSRAYTDAILRQADLVERNINALHPDDALVAHNHADLQLAKAQDKVALIHCVEGGFHLGGTADEVTEAVGRLADRGIAYVTLAHLVWRQVATDAPAIPMLPDWLYRALFPQPEEEGLSELGRAAVKAMAERRILIDLSHMSERSVSDTLSHLNGLDVPTPPVIATHSCFRFGSQEYALNEYLVGRIADGGGVIGLIMAQHQVCDGVSRLRVRSLDRSIEIICNHIDRMAAVTGHHNHLAIGSDLDGFIKPTMAGIESMADMARLQRELERRYGEEIAHKICFANAMRVLEEGWGGGTGESSNGTGAADRSLGAPPQRL